MILRAQLPLPFLQLVPLLSLMSTVLGADSYIGCYSSLPSSYSKSSEYEYQSSAHCDTTCANYAYFALHNGNECICGNSAPSGSQSSSCDTACYGYGQENCGGSSAYSFWSTGNQVSDSDDSSSDGNSATSSQTSGASGSTTTAGSSAGSSTETSTSQSSTAASTSGATATSGTTSATTSSTSTSTTSTTTGASAAAQNSKSTTEQTSSTTKAVSTESDGGTTIVVMSTVAVSATPTVTATTTSIASGTASSSSTKSSSSSSATASKDSSSSSSSSSSSKSSVVGPVVGGVVGGVAFLAILALLIFLFKRRNERARDAELADSAYQDALKRDPSQLASRPISNPFLTKEEHLKMTDQRLNPVMLGRRRISEGSLADEADYSRKILRVANPDDDDEL